MPYKNCYQKCGKISEKKSGEILRYFALDLTASDTARLTGISVRSINNIYIKIRYLLASECEKQTPFSGVIELDESYFGPKRARGKRGRGAKGKTIVFGILKRDDKVYTEIVPNASSVSLPIDSIINTDGWRGYNGLVGVGFEKHYRVKHCENEFAKDLQHINGIESF